MINCMHWTQHASGLLTFPPDMLPLLTSTASRVSTKVLALWMVALAHNVSTIVCKNIFGHIGVAGNNFTTVEFQPAKNVKDTNGDYIQAHGGGVLYHNGVFYWYGENKNGPTYNPRLPGYSPPRVDVIGVSCYSSADLSSWHYEGLVLKAGVHSDLHPAMVVERPKVIYNDVTKRFVMWMHVDTADYELARVGVATSSNPTGPFSYLGSFRPHGQEARDLTIFKDDDGSAYLLYSSEGNAVMHIGQLTEDYTRLETYYVRTMVDLKREAPAVFKHNGIYYLLTSGCTGWEPNRAEIFASTHLFGNWISLGNPCSGGSDFERATTFFSQGTFVLPIPGYPGKFIFMADQWDTHDLASSRYLWLPLWVLDSESGSDLPTKWLRERDALQVAGTKEKVSVDVVVRWFRHWNLQSMLQHPLSLE